MNHNTSPSLRSFGLLIVVLSCTMLLSLRCGSSDQDKGSDEPKPSATVEPTTEPIAGGWTFEVLKSYPHDTSAFTQGLIYRDGALYESTGQYGESNLRRVTLETGEVEYTTPFASNYFGEGLTYFNETYYVLTWKARVALAFSESGKSFEPTDGFGYDTEGWGLTNDGTNLIMSDGTSTVRFLDPESFKVVREIDVTYNGKAVTRLNELEYIEGELWANVWQTSSIAVIDPKTGEVTKKIDVDLDQLFPEENLRSQVSESGSAVLNGIAYDAATKRLFITGKLWPKLFEVKLVEAAAD